MVVRSSWTFLVRPCGGVRWKIWPLAVSIHDHVMNRSSRLPAPLEQFCFFMVTMSLVLVYMSPKRTPVLTMFCHLVMDTRLAHGRHTERLLPPWRNARSAFRLKSAETEIDGTMSQARCRINFASAPHFSFFKHLAKFVRQKLHLH